MSVPINHTGRLAGNQRGWAIQPIRTRKHRRTRETVRAWEGIRSDTSNEGAVNGLAELLLTTSGVETLAEVLAETENASEMLGQALRLHADGYEKALPMSGEISPGLTARTERRDMQQVLPFLTSVWPDDLAMRLARYAIPGTSHVLAGFMLSRVWNHYQWSRGPRSWS